MRFLFRLDLNLHAGTGKKIGILIFGTKHGASLIGRMSGEPLNHECPVAP